LTPRWVRTLGTITACGFLAASAVMNYLFGEALGRTPLEATTFGAVSVLAVAFNALSPFFMAASWEARRYLAFAGATVLWLLCLIYCLTSALGFAAENRGDRQAIRESLRADYESVVSRLADLEATRAKYKRPPGKLDDRIDRLRDEARELRTKGALVEADPQSRLLSKLGLGLIGENSIRTAIVALFAALVEAGAALGLFLSLRSCPSRNERPPAPIRAAPPAAAPRWRPNQSSKPSR
jgi:hypothetical protein